MKSKGAVLPIHSLYDDRPWMQFLRSIVARCDGAEAARKTSSESRNYHYNFFQRYAAQQLGSIPLYPKRQGTKKLLKDVTILLITAMRWEKTHLNNATLWESQSGA